MNQHCIQYICTSCISLDLLFIFSQNPQLFQHTRSQEPFQKKGVNPISTMFYIRAAQNAAIEERISGPLPPE
jgi:hypothetical protein